MKNRYRSVKVGSCGGTFYCEDTKTSERKSLRTKDEAEAERLVHAKNEAERQPQIDRRMGMVYLSATDPDTPESRRIQPPEEGRIVALHEVGGLHHRYVRIAA